MAPLAQAAGLRGGLPTSECYTLLSSYYESWLKSSWMGICMDGAKWNVRTVGRFRCYRRDLSMAMYLPTQGRGLLLT